MNIVWDLTNHKFLESTDNRQQIQRIDWLLRDQVPVTLNIYTYDLATDAYTAEDVPAGWAIKFSAKQASGLTGANLVFQGTWASGGIGVYTATVDLNVEGLIAVVEAASGNNVELVAEFTLSDISGNHRDSSQFTLRVIEDVYRGTEGTPANVGAAFPWIEEYTDSATGKKCLRFKNSDGETLEVMKPAGV